MERYDYEEAVRNDVREYLADHWEEGRRIKDSDRIDLHDAMFVDDGVTGNESGTYTFSAYEAEENVCHNLDLLGEALDEFGVDSATLAQKMCGEWADVTIRCMMLGRVEDDVFDEWNEKIDEAEETEEKEE